MPGAVLGAEQSSPIPAGGESIQQGKKVKSVGCQVGLSTMKKKEAGRRIGRRGGV